MHGPQAPVGPFLLHASAVKVGSSGLLILGKSGSGKSSLAIQLMSFGATLVADDRVVLTPQSPEGLMMSAPETLHGQIEARGVGILSARATAAQLTHALDLENIEPDRLPETHSTVIGGDVYPCLRKVESAAFPSMLMAYLSGGRRA